MYCDWHDDYWRDVFDPLFWEVDYDEPSVLAPQHTARPLSVARLLAPSTGL